MRVYREKNRLKISLDSGLVAPRPVYPFYRDFPDEETAEAFRIHFNQQLEKDEVEVASRPWHYLEDFDLRILKRWLNKHVKKEGYVG